MGPRGKHGDERVKGFKQEGERERDVVISLIFIDYDFYF